MESLNLLGILFGQSRNEKVRNLKQVVQAQNQSETRRIASQSLVVWCLIVIEIKHTLFLRAFNAKKVCYAGATRTILRSQIPQSAVLQLH